MVARIVERAIVWAAAIIAAGAIAVVLLTVFPSPLRTHFSHLYSSEKPAIRMIDLAEQALNRHDLGLADRLAAQAIAQDSSNAEDDNRAGNVAVQCNDVSAAERYYLLGEAVDKRYAWNFVALGELYARRGALRLADAQLRAALSLAPDTRFLHYDLAVVELQERLGEAALSDFEAELRINPAYASAAEGKRQALARVKLDANLRLAAGARKAAAQAKAARAAQALALHDIAPPGRSAPKIAALPAAKPARKPNAKIANAAARQAPKAVAARALSDAELQRAASAASNVATAAAPNVAPARSRPAWSKAKPSPKPAAQSLLALAGDAKAYLLDVTSDLNFTRALPGANPDESTASLQAKISAAEHADAGGVAQLLRAGTSALISGRLALAESAYALASAQAPHDWRGPYFGGLTAQANGDNTRARALFVQAAERSARAEPLTSLALMDAQNGDFASAFVEAKRAASIDPAYGPARFVTGMLALMQADGPTAERHLAAAVALGGAPPRTQAFLSAIYSREGNTAQVSTNG
jgi:hypothetical protein